MGTIAQNLHSWDVAYDWQHQGREWSKDWGGVEMQWHGSILPRIHAFIPTRCILEIGPGFGRWTHFLKDLCDRLIVVDLSKKCIRACRHRFRHCAHISYHTNDGRSLDAVVDGTVDFVQWRACPPACGPRPDRAGIAGSRHRAGEHSEPGLRPALAANSC